MVTPKPEGADDLADDFLVEVHVIRGGSLKGIGRIAIRDGRPELSFDEY
ncbi:hypothetical protein [Nonomuraea sp. NPDC005650]